MVPGLRCWMCGPGEVRIRLSSPSVALSVGRLGDCGQAWPRAEDAWAALVGQH